MYELFAFALVNLLGVISPGPDFAIVSHYGLKGSRSAALRASFGVGAALLIHVLYCVLGLAWLLQSSPWLFNTIQILGALYLGYLGIRILGSKQQPPAAQELQQDTNRKAFTAGFFTNLLNPKATLFLLSLFTQFVRPETSTGMKTAFALLIPLTAVAWFSLLSYLFTHPLFLPRLQRVQKPFTLVMGTVLLLLSLSVIVSLFWK